MIIIGILLLMGIGLLALAFLLDDLINGLSD